MRARISAAFVVAMMAGLSAQSPAVSYTVGIWAAGASVTDPPVSTPVTYPITSVRCGQAKFPSTPAPIINPEEARFDDPASVSSDCTIDITAQVAALNSAVGLRAAFRANGATSSRGYGAFTDPFERRLGPPPFPQNPRLR